MVSLAESLGKSYVVWQEIFDNGVKVKTDTVVEVWKNADWQKEVNATTKAGYSVILSAPWYLSAIQYGPSWIEVGILPRLSVHVLFFSP